MTVPVLAVGVLFTCTPILLADGDGPVWCKEGPRVRIAGIAARERDGSCRPGQPCPSASADTATLALANLFGGPRGITRLPGSQYPHIKVTGATMRCQSTGPAKGNRTGAFCTLANGADLSCAMLATQPVLRWDRYWTRNFRCR